jgi:hypothetical protein
MNCTISSFAQLTFTGTQRIADIVELGFIGKSDLNDRSFFAHLFSVDKKIA